MLRVAGLLFALLQLAAPIHAAPLGTLIEEYDRNFSGGVGSVERLYDLSRVIADSILLSEHTSEELAVLAIRLPGMIVFRGETVLVAPDVPTFLSLARRRGGTPQTDEPSTAPDPAVR